jgi:hypothetical protein
LRQYSERVATLRRRIGFQLHPADLPLFNTRNIEPGQTGVLADAETGRVLCEKAIVGAHDELHLMLRLADESPVIRPGTLVRFAFTRHHDGAYAPRLKAAGSEGASLLLLEHTPDLGRRQMRQYIRAEADLPMKIRLVSRIRTDAGQAPEGVFDGRTIDISGGGISFRTDPLLLPGDVVGCWISLPDGPLGEAPTRVLRVSQDSGPDSPVMRYHAEFQDMPFRQRDRLVRLAGKLLSRPARKTQ